MPMHVISKRILQDYYRVHPQAEKPLLTWYKIITAGTFGSFHELKQTFNSADYVDHLTVFDVGGNNIRIITAIHYNRHKVFIRYVLSHTEYNTNRWKRDAMR